MFSSRYIKVTTPLKILNECFQPQADIYKVKYRWTTVSVRKWAWVLSCQNIKYVVENYLSVAAWLEMF